MKHSLFLSLFDKDFDTFKQLLEDNKRFSPHEFIQSLNFCQHLTNNDEILSLIFDYHQISYNNDMNEFIVSLIKDDNIDYLNKLLPYLSEQNINDTFQTQLTEFILSYYSNQDGEKASSILHFLENNHISHPKGILSFYLTNKSIQPNSDVFKFSLHQASDNQIITSLYRILNKHDNDILLDVFYPFILNKPTSFRDKLIAQLEQYHDTQRISDNIYDFHISYFNYLSLKEQIPLNNSNSNKDTKCLKI